MADEEMMDDQELTVPEMWQLIKPVNPDEEDDEDDAPKKKPPPPPKVGKLMKMLNDIEEPDDLEAKVQERDPATDQSVLLWATLNQKFVVVEWLIKKCKRGAFAFAPGDDNQIAIFDKWVEIRKEVAEREKERAANPPAEGDDEEEEEREPEPMPEQLVFDALSEFHDDWGRRGNGLVKLVGELGVYQGARDNEYTKEGTGQTLYPNGDMYCGEYRGNKRHGTGTYFWASKGMIYTGKWVANTRDGVGRIIYPDGGRYLGGWAEDKPNGEGRYTYPDGSSFAGAWEGGAKNGYGTYTFTDGSQFIGAFIDGDFVSGEWRMAGGSTRYYGAFQNDVPVGSGAYIFKYGTDNSFRQEGTYVAGKWNPVGPVLGSSRLPSLRIIAQSKDFELTFTGECGALSMEQLVQVGNFGPFITWVRNLNANQTAVALSSVLVSSVKFNAEKSVEEVQLKVVATSADGKRIKGIDAITLAMPVTRLLVVLTNGDKTVCLLERAPCAASSSNQQLTLPAVRPTQSGGFSGAFVATVEPALRLHITRNATRAVLEGVCSAPEVSSKTEAVVSYIQTIHADAMAQLTQRLAEHGGASGLVTVASFQLSDVPLLSTDALTLAAVARLRAMMGDGSLPTATVEEQRPPTPLAPAAEPCPDIEPLLEAERRALAAKKAAQDDEE